MYEIMCSELIITAKDGMMMVMKAQSILKKIICEMEEIEVVNKLLSQKNWWFCWNLNKLIK